MWFFFSNSFNEINKLWEKCKVMAFFFFFKWICLPSSKIQGLSKLTFFRIFWVLLLKSWQWLTDLWLGTCLLFWNSHFLYLQTRNGRISPSNRHLTSNEWWWGIAKSICLRALLWTCFISAPNFPVNSVSILTLKTMFQHWGTLKNVSQWTSLICLFTSSCEVFL